MGKAIKNVIFGPAGTGKTTYLVKQVHKVLREYPQNEIGFVSFSKAAAGEAKNKLAADLGIIDVKKAGFDYFGTIHSLAYHAMLEEGNIRSVAKPENYQKFCEENRLTYTIPSNYTIDTLFEDSVYNTIGNLVFQAIDMARIISPDNPYLKLPREITVGDNWIKKDGIENKRCEWEQYKLNEGLVDFTDMLLYVKDKGYKPPISVLFVDEFQDLNPLQYQIYQKWVEDLDAVYIAGDDDQNIYEPFLGTNPQHFLNEAEKADNLIILNQSHRLPKRILEYTQNFIKHNKNRQEKEMYSTIPGGEVHTINLGRFQNIKQFFHLGETHMILTLTNRNVAKISRELDQLLIPHKIYRRKTFWESEFIQEAARLFHDFIYKGQASRIAAYHIAIKTRKMLPHGAKTQITTKLKNLKNRLKEKRGNKEPTKKLRDAYISKKEFYNLFGAFQKWQRLPLIDILEHIALPRTRVEMLKKAYIEEHLFTNFNEYHVGTIHSSKGRQADNIYLLTNLSKRFEREDNKNPEYMRRLFYTGSTRPLKRLYIIKGCFDAPAYYQKLPLTT